MKLKSKISSALLFSIVILGATLPQHVEGVIAPGSIVIRTNGGGIYPDYALYIAQFLATLFDDWGLSFEVRAQEWTVFMGTLYYTHDYDLAIRNEDFSILDPDPSGYYHLGNNNPELLLDDLPYVSESLEILKEAQSNPDQEVRIQKYIEWSNLVMDKIVNIFPLFSERETVFFWENTYGFDPMWGLVDSLPHMYFDGYHEGQLSLDEFNFAIPNWVTLNGLIQRSSDHVSRMVSDLINEPILQIDPYTQIPLNTGLIESWEVINDTHYAFHLRDDIYWSPSYNITGRTSDSLPLNSSDISTLMSGLKGENSDGTNQKLTAKDVVFSLLAYSNPLVSSCWPEYTWIEEIELNPIDELTFNLIIDGDPDTPEQEYYAPMWSKLKVPCLPEFFFNSTSLNVTQSCSGMDMIGLYEDIDETDVWKTFSSSAFGCGKYQLDYHEEDTRTVLSSNPNWFNISAIDGSIQDLDFSTMNIRILSEDLERQVEFKMGKLDYIKPEIPFWHNYDARFYPKTSISSKVSCLSFNLRRPFIGAQDNFVNSTYEGKEEYTKASTIRKAMCYAIDRIKISNELNINWYPIQHGLINMVFSDSYSNEVFDYEYDFDSALEWWKGVRPTTSSPITTIPFGLSFLLGILSCSVYVLRKKRRERL